MMDSEQLRREASAYVYKLYANALENGEVILKQHGIEPEEMELAMCRISEYLDDWLVKELARVEAWASETDTLH